ncbi:sigma-70 family RNA polymerase sigma factor [Actinoplanes sp. NBRC 103695]|uniref:sigma-70 family RNA polymerase sigma factor n=1 Tax=Actinoplanes sp. NBRC 103695 TaxID=3032202 RepID=UPI0024A04CC1|nr:sigma-70 family RNA polymerase sigma factor [Actinoplanes sp. NBRC 103695]GLY98753.1 RNA polymerase sigma factor SigL [Actinoplanes sp. NBRC 103695]
MTTHVCDDRLDAEARMTALHAEHAPELLRFLVRLNRGERQTAEDMLQETMLRAWRHLDSLPAAYDDARRWLFTVARRIAIDAIRRRQTRPVEVGLTDLTWVADRDDSIAAAVAVHGFRNAFRSLTAAHRTVLTEIYLRGHEVDEVADRLGVPVGTVKSRAHYALRSLRTALNQGY